MTFIFGYGWGSADFERAYVACTISQGQLPSPLYSPHCVTQRKLFRFSYIVVIVRGMSPPLVFGFKLFRLLFAHILSSLFCWFGEHESCGRELPDT
jgi:hypothetical protein